MKNNNIYQIFGSFRIALSIASSQPRSPSFSVHSSCARPRFLGISLYFAKFHYFASHIITNRRTYSFYFAPSYYCPYDTYLTITITPRLAFRSTKPPRTRNAPHSVISAVALLLVAYFVLFLFVFFVLCTAPHSALYAYHRL